MHDDADAIVEAIESAPQFKEMEKAEADVDRIDTEKMNLDRKWAKIQRFIRVAENVALASNLRRRRAAGGGGEVQGTGGRGSRNAGTRQHRSARRAARTQPRREVLRTSGVESVGCDPLVRQEEEHESTRIDTNLHESIQNEIREDSCEFVSIRVPPFSI